MPTARSVTSSTAMVRRTCMRTAWTDSLASRWFHPSFLRGTLIRDQRRRVRTAPHSAATMGSGQFAGLRIGYRRSASWDVYTPPARNCLFSVSLTVPFLRRGSFANLTGFYSGLDHLDGPPPFASSTVNLDNTLYRVLLSGSSMGERVHESLCGALFPVTIRRTIFLAVSLTIYYGASRKAKSPEERIRENLAAL